MRYPDYLKSNGTIGLVAPSFGCSIEPYYSAFLHAQKKWKSLGYKLDLGLNCYAQEGIGISNTPLACGTELTEYYLSKENECLISCGGGELMCEILDYVDFEQIKKAHPKWYMGYSDNTNMTFLLATLCDTASIYGPCASSFGMEVWHDALHDAMNILTGKKAMGEAAGSSDWCVKNYDGWEKESLKSPEQPLAPYNITEPLKLRNFLGGVKTEESLTVEGRLLGGCLDCLITILGTKYDKVTEFAERYQQDGILWFIESCNMDPMAIRRAMWQMEHAGWFRYAKGFLIGRPGCYGQEVMGLDQYQAVLGILEKYNVPIIMDMDLGHLPPMMPIVTGSYGKVSVEKNQMTLEMSKR